MPGGVESEAKSSNLWVGNLPLDLTESTLADLFGKHGLLNGITCYPSRNYAFVYYKRFEDAASAKHSLQGFLINGNPIKIDFAKPANPSKHVWVGGFGSSVKKEELLEELSNFGTIEDFKFIRDRNIALVDFARLEDATLAVKKLNGLQICGDRIRVDYLRSQPARRDQFDLPEVGSTKFRCVNGIEPSWMINPDIMGNCPDLAYLGHKRPQPSQSFGGHIAGHPSKVLWVGYPPSVVVDEEMLHNAMILYGEIEKIMCFPGRHCSFIEFRSVDEARRAKEALEGRLFNDPRITIMYFSSELAPGKDFGPPYPGNRGQMPDMFASEVPFQMPLMDIFALNFALAPNRFPAPPAPNVLLGPGGGRQFSPRGSLDLLLPTTDFNYPCMLPVISDATTKAPVGMNQRKLSPAAGLLPAPAVPSSTSHKTSGWDVLDPTEMRRDSKRSRTDGPTSFNNVSPRDEYVLGVNRPHGAAQFTRGPIARVHADSRLSPAHVDSAKQHADEDYVWRGVIAKGGTPVCHARCVPMVKGLEFKLPEVVNCSARTGLDMLTKHYAGAVGFDIVFFLPDTEDDFSNYTEFLRYLGSKNRAGVAKLDNGTTLFLVPPSTFLTDVLKVIVDERLYGVVLKLQEQFPCGATAPQQVHQPIARMQTVDRLLARPADEYVAPDKHLAVQMDCCRAAVDQPKLPPKAPLLTGSVSQGQSSDVIPSASQPGVKLTPELIATLASLLPANAQSSVAQSAQAQFSSSSSGLQLPVFTNEKGASRGFSGDPQVLGQIGQLSQQYGSQQYRQLTTTVQSFSSNLNVKIHPFPVLPESKAVQNPIYNLQEQGPVSYEAHSIHPSTAQSQQFVQSTQGTHPYPFRAPLNTEKVNPMVQGAPIGSYALAGIQQPKVLVSYPNLFDGADISRPKNVILSSNGNINADSLNNAERLQGVSSGVGQGTAEEVEADKNQRYQSTLQFAASLLLQIQQQQASSDTRNQQ